MEKTVTKRKLKEFRDRENPWQHRSHIERLCALTEICFTQNHDAATQPGFPRVYQITRKTRS